MTATHITPNNIANYNWIWDFLEEQRKAGQYVWQPNKDFRYNGLQFQFAQKVFARQRKEIYRGYAYEMESKDKLGEGAFGSVYNISCTISNGKTGIFQVTNKARVVKNQLEENAIREYKMAKYAVHLHAKQPIQGRMVMKKMEGQTLYTFLKANTTSRCGTLYLIRALLQAYKTQVTARQLVHNDLHAGNILIQYNANHKHNPYEINIIDFGLAQYIPIMTASKIHQMFYHDELNLFISYLWSAQKARPQLMTKLLQNNSASLEEYISVFEKIVVAPTASTQEPLDWIFTYLDGLAKTHHDIAHTLQTIMKNGVNHSTAQNVNAIKNAVLACKEILEKHHLDPAHKFTPVFNTDSQKQKMFNNIFNYFNILEQKGKQLAGKSQKKEGDQLCNLVARLRKETFDAAHTPDSEQKNALLVCANTCKQLLEDNQNFLNIHQNNNYIWAEIAVVFSSLIVLYPLVAGINYLCTGRVGFFSQTKAATTVEQMHADFKTLNAIQAC
jgi:serine/threonine protein kinase